MTPTPQPPDTPHRRVPGLAAALLAVVLLLTLEPAFANKLETISSGFSGASGFKRSWLTRFLVITGGLSLSCGVLACVVPHTNASFLNFGNWRQSALVLFAMGGGLLLLATLL